MMAMPLDAQGARIEPHVPLPEAARILGVAHKTLLCRLSRGEADELRAIKIFGRWKVPESALRDLTCPSVHGGSIPTTSREAKETLIAPVHGTGRRRERP